MLYKLWKLIKIAPKMFRIFPFYERITFVFRPIYSQENKKSIKVWLDVRGWYIGTDYV